MNATSPSSIEKERVLMTLLRADSNYQPYAQQDLGVVLGRQFQGDSLSDASDQFIRGLRAEGNHNKALADFQLIDRTLRSWESRGSATDQFLRLLTGDSSYQPYAAQDYSKVDATMRSGEDRAQVVDTLLTLLRAEGNHDKALAAYDVVDRNLHSSESRATATEQFVRLLTADSSYHPYASQDYSIVDGSIRPGESRQGVTDDFIQLLRGAGDHAVTVSTFAHINNSLLPGESRGRAVDQYLRLYHADSSYHPYAAADYSMIQRYVTSGGPSREALTDQFIRLLNQTGDHAAATRDFTLVQSS